MNRNCEYCGGKQPTTEQIKALNDFARENGRMWKVALRRAWQTGNYEGCQYAPVLQQIRNTFGPSWLQSYRASNNELSEISIYTPLN